MFWGASFGVVDGVLQIDESDGLFIILNIADDSEELRMMNDPSLSSIWSTPSTTPNEAPQNIKTPNNDFSEPPPTSGTVPTSSWPMYQQNRNT
jgi:hypothetical protein